MSIFAGVYCDKCGAEIIYDHIGKTHIKRWIREKGWSVSSKSGREITLCPHCRKQPKQKRGGNDGQVGK